VLEVLEERNETEVVNFGSSNERRGPELTKIVKKVRSDKDDFLILWLKDEDLVVGVREVVCIRFARVISPRFPVSSRAELTDLRVQRSHFDGDVILGTHEKLRVTKEQKRQIRGSRSVESEASKLSSLT